MKAVIMAGGQGTRFWPLSRQSRPKQFLKIAGAGTMLQETAARLAPIIDRQDILVVCGRDYVDIVRDQLPDFGLGQIVVEPTPRNTAPCIGLAAAALRLRFGNVVMAILPADHVIEDTAAFQDTLAQAETLALEGWMVTFGIEPTFPSTGYGYIHRDAPICSSSAKPAFQVKRFIEKPPAELARRFMDSGEYYWNSGMFVWTVDTVMEQFRLHMPELSGILQEIEAGSADEAVVERLFPLSPRVSIDFGVMEKSDRAAVIPCSLGWSDVGNWRAAQDLSNKDRHGIAGNTRHVAYKSRNCLFHSTSGKLVAAVGVDNVILVETPDAILLCHRDHAEDVKQIVEELRREGRNGYL